MSTSPARRPWGRRALALAGSFANRRKERQGRRAPGPKRLVLRRKPRNIPLYWGRISLPSGEPFPLRVYSLTLSARSVPWLASTRGELYVPALYARKAEAELAAYARENRALPPPPPPVVYHNAAWMLGSLLLLLFWHGLLAGWWPGLEQAAYADRWKAAGVLDVFRVAKLGEWWRCLTALTLHSDSQHLFGNVSASMIFLVLLGRMTGAGPALLLTVLSGALGNALNVLYRPMSHSSLGFSTALFGIVGLVAAVYAVRATGKGRILLPLAAGVGILASLGTGTFQDNTDYAAHIFGLLAGMLFGAGYGTLLLRVPEPSLAVRGLCACGAALLLGVAWWLALLAA